MEEIKDFDEWYSSFVLPPVEYVAVFDNKTGRVKSIGPSHAFLEEKWKLPIDKELAESIINAEIQVSSCFVNINSNTLEIAETKSVYKIDDVLHRIPSKKYSDIRNPEIYLTHDKKKKILKIELSEELGGTKKPKDPYKKREIIWDGETKMNFFITDYNDPNVPYQVICVIINELVGKSKIIENFDYKTFSVYTRRLFKNYIIEYR